MSLMMILFFVGVLVFAGAVVYRLNSLFIHEELEKAKDQEKTVFVESQQLCDELDKMLAQEERGKICE